MDSKQAAPRKESFAKKVSDETYDVPSGKRT